MTNIAQNTIRLTVQGIPVNIAYLHRPGPSNTLLCLHGFGSTKEDYADLAIDTRFSTRDLVMIDAPGFGDSSTNDPNTLSIDFLVEATIVFCDALGLQKFHLLGHSMGGLTALMLCHQYRERVLSFIDIEGNVAPEDCFLSRQIIEYPEQDPKKFLQAFIERISQRPEFSSRLYAKSLPLKVQATSISPVFHSMVTLSDTAPLMNIMTNLPFARLFIYGEQNRHLSYLEQLSEHGVNICEIPLSGHFPMYSNAPALWQAMHQFLNQVESPT